MNNISLGKLGEQSACDFLRHKGYKIIIQNYRCKMGEIDIIAEKSGEIVFVEVKTRTNVLYGSPAEAVNYRKQQKILRTALCYLSRLPNSNVRCRFDILEILMYEGQFHYNHIINAFGN
jgi:putative endonuclease